MSSPKGAGATTLLVTVAAVLVALVAAALISAGPACRTGETRQHDEAVFGHFTTSAAARRFAATPKRAGFQGLKIENDGCGDFELEIDGADTQKDRSSFAAEAAKAGFQVTFEQTGEPLSPPPGQVVGVFAKKATLTAANALAWKLAAQNFRYIDIVPSNGRWLVVMPQVPVKAALGIAREAATAGFHLQFRSS
jgi:hypothetical protein